MNENNAPTRTEINTAKGVLRAQQAVARRHEAARIAARELAAEDAKAAAGAKDPQPNPNRVTLADLIGYRTLGERDAADRLAERAARRSAEEGN